MKHPALRCAVAALLLSGTCSTYAADPYWYAGLGMGLGHVQFYPADFSSGGSPTCSPRGTCSESKEESDVGFKGFFGYQFNQNWAAEVSFVSLGKFHYKYDDGTVTQDGVYQVSGWGYSVVPTIPLTRDLSVFGRLGAFISQARLTFYNSGFIAGATSSGQQFGDATFLTGFGAQYFFNGENGMRIEYENFGKVGNECNPNVTPPVACTGRANAKMLSVSAVFRF